MPLVDTEFFIASAAAFDPPTDLPDASSFSIFEIASYMHLAISSTATMLPSVPSTGK